MTARVIPIDEIRAAREALAGIAVRTPLIRLQVDAPAELYLKLENLQPIGSFKIRGASNAMAVRSPDELARGVITASAGNMAQGVAWGAKLRGIPCTVVVPDYAPKTKIAAIERLGGTVIPVPFADWWKAIQESRFPGLDGVFIHPVLDDAVMAGNGTIGLELIEDLPDLDAVVVPWGGGGLTCGIASALRVLRPEARIYSVEPETGAPMALSFAAGESLPVDDYRASFVDGSGSKSLLPKMWELGRELIAGGLVSSLDETAAAVRMLAERARVVAEGAGALSLAAALAGRAGSGRVVCIVSGGNIDAERLRAVLAGETPGVAT
ncbi:MAG: threonine/serine dehydratase [Gaiellales bacterium]